MPPTIKSTQELNEYIVTLEKRLESLESQQKKDIFSPSFLKRAFEIWGHWLIANSLIGMVLGGIATIIYMCAVLGFIQAIMHNSGPIVTPTPFKFP